MTRKPEHDRLIKKIRKLKINSDIFGEAFMNDPRPRWYKIYREGKFSMLIVNRSFTTKTGITMPAYYMRNDSDVWPEDIVDIADASDMLAVKRRVRVTIEERVRNPLTGNDQIWVGFKTPRFDIKTNEVIGVHGQADLWEPEVWEHVPESIKKVIKLEQ